MMAEEKSLEGWVPTLDESLTINEVIEMAYDYRGNTTIVKSDGSTVEGYIFNRSAEAPEPFLEYFDKSGGGPFTLSYSKIANVEFSGKDTAAGKSWEAWQRRKAEARSREEARRAVEGGEGC